MRNEIAAGREGGACAILVQELCDCRGEGGRGGKQLPQRWRDGHAHAARRRCMRLASELRPRLEAGGLWLRKPSVRPDPAPPLCAGLRGATGRERMRRLLDQCICARLRGGWAAVRERRRRLLDQCI
jgi:hypothetical protein